MKTTLLALAFTVSSIVFAQNTKPFFSSNDSCKVFLSSKSWNKYYFSPSKGYTDSIVDTYVFKSSGKYEKRGETGTWNIDKISQGGHSFRVSLNSQSNAYSIQVEDALIPKKGGKFSPDSPFLQCVSCTGSYYIAK